MRRPRFRDIIPGCQNRSCRPARVRSRGTPSAPPMPGGDLVDFAPRRPSAPQSEVRRDGPPDRSRRSPHPRPWPQHAVPAPASATKILPSRNPPHFEKAAPAQRERSADTRPTRQPSPCIGRDARGPGGPPSTTCTAFSTRSADGDAADRRRGTAGVEVGACEGRSGAPLARRTANAYNGWVRTNPTPFAKEPTC